MKQLVLKHKHEALGAKMVPFAGFEMPVTYEGVIAEHETVRKGVGIFDVSHMGEFLITGEGALPLIQAVTSNDASKLTDGKIQYSCLPNEQGGIVDDLLVYRVSEIEYMLVVNASNIEKDWDWISKHNTFGAEMRNISDDYCLFAVQGPKAKDALADLTPYPIEAMDYYTFVIDRFAGVEDVIISATGYTGAGGFEIYVHKNDAEKVFDAIMKKGEKHGLKPIGLAARDTLRLEMGYCLYGNDINDTTSPIEAGLGWITKFSKPFTNSEALKSQKEQGVSKKLIGFELIDKGVPRHDYKIVDAAGNEIGIVTSGTMSPSLKKSIGMGYVTKDFSALNSEIFVQVREKNLKAKVVSIPFLASGVKIMKKGLFIVLFSVLTLFTHSVYSWGFYCHKLINQKAVYALPPGMIQFYKDHEAYLSKHAVDPDLRKHSVEKEGAQHYIDIDHYGLHPFDSVPRFWKNAVAKYSEDTLRKYGVLPWTINDYYYRLVKAFKDMDTAKILKISADLGHYAADACVPLHVTENYDGQFTQQQGIHRLWETLIPERFSKSYKLDYTIAHYIHHPLDSTWTVLQHSFSLKDKVLNEDKKLREKFEQDKLYEIYTGKKKKDFSVEYIKQYNATLDGMVEKQLLASIEFVSSLWYSAWVEAGQPVLVKK